VGNPLFEQETAADLEVEMLQDLLATREELERQLEQEHDLRERVRLRERLEDLHRALGEKKSELVEDPLVDEWEAEILAGRTPNFQAGRR
jgi:hypothetical protein